MQRKKPKFSRDCGLPLQVTQSVTCSADILGSLVIAALVIATWVQSNVPTYFIYEPQPQDSFLVRQGVLEGCVRSWVLLILLIFSIIRILSSVILILGLRKESFHCAQFWIALKGLSFLMSLFVIITSLTTPTVQPPAIVSFAVDLFTCYFICILHPQIERMEKGIPLLKK